MHEKKELCDRIRSIYPEVGECGIDVNVDFDKAKNAWIVDLKKGEHQLITHLEPQDANTCMEGKQCVSLGAQIAQLVENIKKA
ncbi:MAG: hypothetical protein ABID54_09385 [Pseudomonadota bacterium]